MADGETTVIGKGITITGEVTGTAPIEVLGTLKGTAGTEGILRVREGGVVDGELAAREVHVDGKVQGQIAAEEKIVLNATSRVQGDLQAKKLAISDGAVFEGSVKMPGRSA
ncbi:MAG: polymer-forming cytoskeletal protein [Acidobacteriota bacterium]